MKIRTDFVTNSSSSSFISVVVTTLSGRRLEAQFESGDNNILPEEPFKLTKKQFQNIESGEDIIERMEKWFSSTFADDSLPEEYDYSEGMVDEIKEIEREDLKEIFISSLISGDEFEYGMDLQYNYETEKYKKEKTGYYEE